MTNHQVVLIKKHTFHILQKTAFQLYNMFTDTGIKINKKIYNANKMTCHMLKLSAKFGFVPNIFHIAMYYHNAFIYREALFVIDITKVK